MSASKCELVVPDAGPLITLAYADRLNLLLVLGIELVVVDVVRHELVRHSTPTSQKILDFLTEHNVRVAETEIGRELAIGHAAVKKHAGERGIQEFLFDFSDSNASDEKYAVLLFEDQKISGTAFVLPDNVYLLSTKAFLIELQNRGLIQSADDVVHDAHVAGREFSQREVNQPPLSNTGVEPF